MRYITTPPFLMFLAGVVLVAGVGSPFAFASDEPEKWVNAIAAAGAVAGFLFAAAAKFHADARDRAFALLVEFQKDKDLNNAIRNVGTFFRLNQGLDVNTVIQLYNSHGRYEIKLRRDIDLVGNFFEDMAIAVRCKEINEEIIEEYFNGLLIRYCVHMRNNNIFFVLRNNPPIANAPFGDTRRPEVFYNLDELYDRWWPRYYYRWCYPI